MIRADWDSTPWDVRLQVCIHVEHPNTGVWIFSQSPVYERLSLSSHCTNQITSWKLKVTDCTFTPLWFQDWTEHVTRWREQELHVSEDDEDHEEEGSSKGLTHVGACGLTGSCRFWSLDSLRKDPEWNQEGVNGEFEHRPIREELWGRH